MAWLPGRSGFPQALPLRMTKRSVLASWINAKRAVRCARPFCSFQCVRGAPQCAAKKANFISFS